MTDTETRASLPDWGLGERSPRGAAYHLTRVAIALVLIAIAAAVTVVVGNAFGPTLAFIASATIGIALFFWITNQGLLALRAAGARRLPREEHEQLWNIVLGLCADMKTTPPALYVTKDGGPNALVCIGRGPALCVSESLLESFTRTELEAVVAHCLVRQQTDDVDRATQGIAVGPFGTRTIPRVGYDDDVRAAAITRYPPALAAAVEKAAPASGRFAPLWFVAEGATHRDPTDRAAALRDL